MSAIKAKKKRAARYIYMLTRKLIDPATGEEVSALVPLDGIQHRLLRERKFRIGQRLRAELKQERDYPKLKLMHKIGALLVDNVDDYASMDSHEAIKDVQAKSGVCCDTEKFVIDLGQFGRHEVERNIPRSISFDEMEEDEFERLFLGATAWIGEHHAHVMLDEVREEFWAMANREQRAA